MYAILNTEKQRLFCVDIHRKYVIGEFAAYRENGEHYKFITVTKREIAALETCKRLGSLIDKRFAARYASVSEGHFVDKSILKSLSKKCLITQDGDFWRINMNSSGVLYHIHADDERDGGVHINVR